MKLTSEDMELIEEEDRNYSPTHGSFSRLLAAYREAAAEIDAAWQMIDNSFDIEPRAELEAEAKTSGFNFGLAQAAHHIWKRDPKVSKLLDHIAEVETRDQKLRDACRRAEMSIMETSGEWHLFDTSARGKELDQQSLDIANKNCDLELENAALRGQLAEVREDAKRLQLTKDIRQDDEPPAYLVFCKDDTMHDYCLFDRKNHARDYAHRQGSDWPVYPLYAANAEEE